MNLLGTINKIIGLAEIGDYFMRKDVYRGFGLGDNAIIFLDHNRFEYSTAIDNALNSDTEIQSSYSRKKYEELLINYFRSFILNHKSATQSDVNSFCQMLKSEEKKTFSVFRNIHGINLNNPGASLSLGDYTIYEFLSQKNVIESKTYFNPECIWLGDKPDYLIEWKAKARHFEKAIEIADQQFERFELVLRYVIGNPTSQFEVGILNYQGWRHRQAYALCETGQVCTSATNHGPLQTATLDDPYFIDDKAGHKYVWELASSNKLNGFQKRILLAIEWIGQSMMDLSPQSAFLKAAISLEIIFTYNKSTIITPSILNQVSEGTALILGESINERIEIESQAKNLYGLRSAIVHSGNKNVSELDYKNMLELSRAVVIRLLTKEALKSITSVEKLYELLKRIKYSGSAI